MGQSGRTVIVVGGGVIGAACAHYLVQSGWQVTILERGDFGQGCSHANCGLVSPSHVLPLAVPGAVAGVFRTMLTPGSPLYIKPRFDPALWSWLWRFARRCNTPDMLTAGRAIQALLQSSRALYEEVLPGDNLACEWETQGVLFVFQHRDAFEHHAHTDQLLREQFQLAAQRYESTELTALEPALKEGLAGGWLYTSDAHLRPDKLLASWRQALQARGVAIQERCEVRDFVSHGSKATAVVTAQGEMAADAFVLAAGAWTPLLRRRLGCRLPIQPGKGYSITMTRPRLCPTRPMIFEEHRVAVTPMQSAYRLGSTMEFAGYDTTLNPRRLELLRAGARHYLQEPCGDEVLEEWYGWRPMTYDSKPIIGRTPALNNVLLAAGHNMLGLSMAPATGKLVAELLNEVPPHVDPQPYAVTRFG